MLQGLWSVLCDVVSLPRSLHLNMNAAFCMGRMPPLHFKGSLGPFKGGEGGDWDLHCFTAMHGQHSLGPRRVQMCLGMALEWNAEIWCSREFKVRIFFIQSSRMECLSGIRAWICCTKVLNISMLWLLSNIVLECKWIIWPLGLGYCNGVCFYGVFCGGKHYCLAKI